MAYLVLARKWRPQTFDEITGQEHVCRILKNAVVQNKVSHAYIFSGPRGVGKTSTARILSKALNCKEGPTPTPCNDCFSCRAIAEGKSLDVIEIDGASNTGVDSIRDLRERVKYAPSTGLYKVYIIDEAHMLSTSAFNALLKTLEEPPPHVTFILATTEPRKIPVTVLSRCQHLTFKRIPYSKIKAHLEIVCNKEGVKATNSAISLIAQAADGSLRDSLTILDQILSFSDEITEDMVKDLLGVTEVETLSKIISYVIDGDIKGLLKEISYLSDYGIDFKIFIKDLILFLRKLLLFKFFSKEDSTVDLTEKELTEINILKDKTSEEHLFLLFSEISRAEPNIRSAFYPRIAFEISLMKLCLLKRFAPINEVIKKLKTTLPQRDILVNDKVISEDQAEGQHKVVAGSLANLNMADIWAQAIKKIEETDHLLAVKLKEAITSFDGSMVKLTFKGGLSILADSVKDNIEFIRKILFDIVGQEITIEIKTENVEVNDNKSLKEKALQNPIVQEALQLFDGKILEVKPLNLKRRGKNV